MHHQKYFSRHKKKLTVLPFPVVCNWSYYRSPFLQPGPILHAAWSNLTNTQGTDVDGRCPLPSNSAQTPPISHFTTLEWSLQQFHTALHRVRGSLAVRGPLHWTLSPLWEVHCTAQRLSPLWVPVYEFEMVTKSQFHPRWATVMVLSGDCSNLKMQQQLFISHFIALWGFIVLFSNVYISK